MEKKPIKLRGEFVSRRVWMNEKELYPGRSQEVFNHSPSGFMWGYGGSGPAQLALAILLELTDEETAVSWHQIFKWEYIARLPHGDFEIEMPIDWAQCLRKPRKNQVQ